MHGQITVAWIPSKTLVLNRGPSFGLGSSLCAGLGLGVDSGLGVGLGLSLTCLALLSVF